MYVLWRCTSLLRVVVSEMTYTVSSGTLNSSIPYHLRLWWKYTEFILILNTGYFVWRFPQINVFWSE